MIGAAMSPITKYIEEPIFDLARRTIEDAIVDAGIDRHSVDGLSITPPSLAYHNTAMFVSRLGEHLGISLKSLACTENGGCSAALALRWAIMEVALGQCDVAVALGVDQRLKEMPAPGETIEAFMDRSIHGTVAVYSAYDGAYGLGPPIPYYAMAAQRYMHETGATKEDLAWAAIRLREHANKNPAAMFHKKALTIEDMNEAMDFIPPLRLSDCSQFVTGAGAVVIANERVASSLNTTPVWLRGWGQSHHPSAFCNSSDNISRYPAVEASANQAFEQANVTRQDIDVAEVYGVFSATELMLCEEIGFFPRGKSGVAFKEGKTTYGGDIVIDPSGGRLSLGHPACATPMLEAYEIFKQLRGEAETRQVPNAKLGLLHAEHGMLNGSAISIWERDNA